MRRVMTLDPAGTSFERRRDSRLAGRDFAEETISYQVVFRRRGRDIETLYWRGSLAEVRELARDIAHKCGADDFRIFEFASDEERQRPRH